MPKFRGILIKRAFLFKDSDGLFLLNTIARTKKGAKDNLLQHLIVVGEYSTNLNKRENKKETDLILSKYSITEVQGYLHEYFKPKLDKSKIKNSRQLQLFDSVEYDGINDGKILCG